MKPTQEPVVGFIGLGIMGRPMAEHLLKAGYPMVVFNRTRSKAEEFARLGARLADTPAQLASQCGVIITMVSDSPDVEEVIAGREGVLQGVRPGTLVVDMSTASPRLEQKLDRLLRQKGSQLLDAPVSGGDVGARQGTLAIMVGGERGAFQSVLPLLEKMGRSITHCGPVGSGQLTKLCNQILVSVNLLAVCEALVFARRNGLDPEVMIRAVEGGAAGSWQLSHLGPRIVRRDFAPGFMVDLMQKDLRLVLEAAQAARIPLPATALVHQLFASLQARELGRLGTQSLARVVEELAGLHRTEREDVVE